MGCRQRHCDAGVLPVEIAAVGDCPQRQLTYAQLMTAGARLIVIFARNVGIAIMTRYAIQMNFSS